MGVEYISYKNGQGARIGPNVRFKGAVLIFVIWTIVVFVAGVSQHKKPSCYYKIYQNLQTGQKVTACVVSEKLYKEPVDD